MSVWGGLKLDHGVARLPKEFGIELGHLDRKGDLVGHALARTVSAGEKLEVLEPIVCLDAVDVMNGFMFVQRAAEFLLHAIPVLKNLSRRFAKFRRDYETKISVAGFSGGVCLFGMFFLPAFAPKSGSALGAAKLVLASYMALLALYWHRLPAFQAVNLPMLIGRRAAFAAALYGAVERTASKFLFIASQAAWHPTERRAACLARESYGGGKLVQRSVLFFISVIASSAAKLSVFFARPRDWKFAAALKASSYRHWLAPLMLHPLGDTGTVRYLAQQETA